jgi:hypothetical protein
VRDPGTDLRRIYLAVKNLPMGVWPDSTHGASWTVESYLLANVLDAIRELTWVTIKVNAGKNAHVKRPEATYRPGKGPSLGKPKMKWSDLPAMLGAKGA